MWYLYASQLTSVFLPIVVLPYLARVLGQDVLGVYLFAYNWTLILQQIIDFGFYLTASRSVALLSRKVNSRELLGELAGEVIGAKFLLFLATIPLSLLLFFLGSIREESLLAGTLLWALAWVLTPVWFYQGLEKFLHVAVVEIPGRLLGLIGVLLFVKNPKDVYLALAIPALIALGVNTLAWVAIRQEVQLRRPRISAVLHRLRESQSIFAYRMSVLFFTLYNPWILGLAAHPKEVGLYYIGERVSKSLLQLLDPALRSLFPKAAYTAISSHKELHFQVKKLCKTLLLTFPLFAAPLYIFRMQIIAFFLGDFEKTAEQVLITFLIIMPFAIVSKVWSTLWLTPLRMDENVRRAFGLGALFNFVLAPVGALLWGAVGVAQASLLAEALVAGLVRWYSKQALIVKEEKRKDEEGTHSNNLWHF